MSENQKPKTTIKVLFFSVLQDAAGGEKEIEWPLVSDSMTVAELIRDFYNRWPGLEAWDSQIRVAVDLAYVDREHVIRAGQEIALMPPVQGG